MEEIRQVMQNYLKHLMLRHGYAGVSITLEQIIKDVLKSKHKRQTVQSCLASYFLKFPTTQTQWYWCLVLDTIESTGEEILLYYKRRGKPYTFLAEDILSKTELENLKLSKHSIYIGQEELLTHKK